MAKHVLLPLFLVMVFVGYGAYAVLGSGTPGSGTPGSGTAVLEVSFESEPAGAAVSVDGEARGVTPLVLRLKPDSYAVQMVLGGYETWTGTVPVVRGAPTPIVAHARLVALTSAVTVIVNPQVPGVRLSVDGAEVAATREGGRFTLSLAPGQHRIGARAAGYARASKQVTVDLNKTATVTLSLQAISITVPTKTSYGPSGWRYSFGATGKPSTLGWTYSWNFDDGTSGSGSRTTHAFASEGDYEVIVKGTTSAGDTAQATLRYHINDDSKSQELSADASPGYCDIRMAGFAILPTETTSPTGYDILCRFEVASAVPSALKGILYYRILFNVDGGSDYEFHIAVGQFPGHDSWSAGWWEWGDIFERDVDGTVNVSAPVGQTVEVRLPLPLDLTGSSTGLQWFAQAWASLGDSTDTCRDETPAMTWEPR